MPDAFDLVVLGGGLGGYVPAIRAAKRGRSVAIVERDKFGGTCLHRGCIPTKAFLESAGFLDRVRRAEEWGIQATVKGFDFKAIAARKDKIVSANEGGVRNLLRSGGIEIVAGEGKLVGPTEVEVGDRRLRARDVILATGSRPKSLPGLEVDGETVVTSDHVTQWTGLPASVVVAGAGAVGAEFASMLRDFGADVTLVEFLPRVLPLEDAEVSQLVQRDLERRGIKVLVGAKILADTVKRSKKAVELEVEVDGKRQKLAAEKLLVATGREPLSQGFGFEEAGVAVERSFVKVDGWMRTSVPHVYATGDLVGGLMLAHVAAHEGEIAVATILGEKVPPVDYDALPRATYTRPEVASIGLTEEAARKGDREVQTGKFSFRANAKALIGGEADGFVKVVSDGGTGEILGVHMVGPHVTELIGELSVAKLLESTPLEVGLAVHPHPTLSEALAEAALDVTGEAIHLPTRRRS
jgi:dihydrolipoamide dehydrogenase